jgi:SUF system NifU family Fe-S assembly protein
LLREGEGVAAQVLRRFNVTAEQVMKVIKAVYDNQPLTDGNYNAGDSDVEIKSNVLEMLSEFGRNLNQLASDGKIDDIRFDGVACTISTASTSIMSELLKGKTTQEAKEIMDNYFKMIDQKEYDEDVLDEAIAFQNVGKQANRINCATIGWKAMREMIKESEDGKDE